MENEILYLMIRILLLTVVVLALLFEMLFGLKSLDLVAFYGLAQFVVWFGLT